MNIYEYEYIYILEHTRTYSYISKHFDHIKNNLVGFHWLIKLTRESAHKSKRPKGLRIAQVL